MFANPPVPLSSTPPVAEKVVSAVGAGAAAARNDHAHERLTSTTVQTLGASGNVTVMFTRSFATMPGVVCTAYKPTDSLPVSFEVPSWVMDGSNYIGCVIHGNKAQALPALTGIVLLLNLIPALASFNPFAGAADGTQFSCVAILASN